MINMILKWVIYTIILILAILFSFYTLKFLRYIKFYGRVNSKRRIIQEIRKRFFNGFKGYDKTKNLLVNSGWSLSVEELYAVKLGIVLLVLVFGVLIIRTNINIKINSIIVAASGSNSDMNIILDSEDEAKERELIEDVGIHLSVNGLAPDDDNAYEYVYGYLSENGHMRSDLSAQRILKKLIDINAALDDYNGHLILILLAYAGYKLPDILAKTKILLINNKKDWECISYMTIYSVVGRLPPYKLDNIIYNMQDISVIYRHTLQEFDYALKAHDKYMVEDILNSVEDESMNEIMETMVLASEIGVVDTIDNIDDLLENKIKWMEVSARKRRGIKSTISLIPVAVILFMLYSYLMYGLNMVNQNMFMNF